MKIADAVQLYIQLRDKIAEEEAQLKERIAPLKEKMTKLEAKLLEVFDTTGMDSVKTEFGTAYSSKRTSASVADRETFMEFVRERDEWGLLIVRPNATAVEQYLESHNDELPPGIDLRVERVVKIRRSA